MKARWSLIAIGWAFLLAVTVHAQTSGICSAAAPCMNLTWQDASMSSTVTTSGTGVEISAPGYATIWRCTGSSSSCAASTIGTSVWSALGPGASAVNAANGTVAQTAASGQYYDQTIAYNTTYNYYVTATWTGGATSAPSAIFQVAVGAAPMQTPGIPLSPAGVVVTSGSYTNPAP